MKIDAIVQRHLDFEITSMNWHGYVIQFSCPERRQKDTVDYLEPGDFRHQEIWISCRDCGDHFWVPINKYQGAFLKLAMLP
jgi:hypothetical protein